MKTFKNIYQGVADFEALHTAYMQVRKGKRDKNQCAKFEQRLEENLINLLEHLNHGSYRPAPYIELIVYEPKKRAVFAPGSFADKILHQAIVNELEKIWEPRFISDSYACRTGKGTHAGADKAQLFLQQCFREHGHVYALKADIRAYFASIRHDILKCLLAKRIGDARMLRLLSVIIDSYHTAGTPGVGIPLGNRTSQLFANIYLDELDQHIKCRLRMRWYVRYMDDFIIIHPSKTRLHGLRLMLAQWLDANLALEFNNKTRVFPVAASYSNGGGVDFLGYHLWPYGRRLRKASLKRFKRRVRWMQRQYEHGKLTLPEIKQQLASWLAHASHGDAQAAVAKFLDENPFIKRSK